MVRVNIVDIHEIFDKTSTTYGSLLPNVKYLIIITTSFLEFLTSSINKKNLDSDIKSVKIFHPSPTHA